MVRFLIFGRSAKKPNVPILVNAGAGESMEQQLQQSWYDQVMCGSV